MRSASLRRDRTRRLGRAPKPAGGSTGEATPGSSAGQGSSRQGGSGRMKRAKPPNVIGRGALLASPGFGVVVVCIVKDEAAYLEEWLAYHAALGVDHFLVYDNGSTDGSAALLERYQNHGLVTRIDWPLGGGQLAAYNHALRFFGRAADWLAYFDVDEFLVPLVDDDIPALPGALPRRGRRPRAAPGVRLLRPPQPSAGLAIDAYTQVANVLDLDPDLPPRVKSIVRPEGVSAIDIHLAFPADVPAPGAPTGTAEEAVRGVAQLNHYYTRSFEEFEAKRVRGSATGRIDRAAVPFDLPTIETNTAAQRFSARTRADPGAPAQPRAAALHVRQRAAAALVPATQRPGPFRRVRPRQPGGRPARAGALRGHAPAQPARRRRARGRPRRGGLPADARGPLRLAAPGRARRAHARPHRGEPRLRVQRRCPVDLADRRRPSWSSSCRTRRCCAAGRSASSSAAPAAVPARAQRRARGRQPSEPVRVALPASSGLAGVVEVEPVPGHAPRLRARLSSEAAGPRAPRPLRHLDGLGWRRWG